MSSRHACSVIAAAVLSCAAAFAQTSPQTPTRTTGQAGAADETPITLVGCIQRESDYRRQTDLGRGGAVGTGAGLGNEYVLINVFRESSPEAIAAAAEADCATNTGEAFELTGTRERELEPLVGRWVQITGMLKHADTEPVGTTGGGVRPSGGFDLLGQDLQLFEINVMSFQAAAAPSLAVAEQQAIGTAGTQEVRAEAPPTRAQPAAPTGQLPRTASPLPVAGVFSLLLLGGALGVRSLRRR